jgi:hypothetical protein
MPTAVIISDAELLTAPYRLAIWDAHGIPYGNEQSVEVDPDPVPHPDYSYKWESLPDQDGIRITWTKIKK